MACQLHWPWSYNHSCQQANSSLLAHYPPAVTTSPMPSDSNTSTPRLHKFSAAKRQLLMLLPSHALPAQGWQQPRHTPCSLNLQTSTATASTMSQLAGMRYPLDRPQNLLAPKLTGQHAAVHSSHLPSRPPCTSTRHTCAAAPLQHHLTCTAAAMHADCTVPASSRGAASNCPE